MPFDNRVHVILPSQALISRSESPSSSSSSSYTASSLNRTYDNQIYDSLKVPETLSKQRRGHKLEPESESSSLSCDIMLNPADSIGNSPTSMVSTITLPPSHTTKSGSPNPTMGADLNNQFALGGNTNNIVGSGKLSDTKLSNSFNYHLIKMERWANWIGTNILSKRYHLNHKGRWKANGHSYALIILWRLFLVFCLFRDFFGSLLVDASDSMLMLYIGDFSNIYGQHIDRFAFNAFKFCWGLHATVIYFWITMHNGQVRKWLINFENRWVETSYYVNKDLEMESWHKMRKGRNFATRFIQVSTLIAIANIALLNAYGYFGNGPDYLRQNLFETVVYGSWSAVHLIWFWVTFVINLTSFGHHYLLCRAIHVRFDETKHDLDYAILSDWSSQTKPEHISKLIAKHYFVCDMVKQANKHLKIYLFIFYIIFAPHLCLMIYQIIFASNSTTQGRIFIGFLLLTSDLFQVYFVSVLSAQINSKSYEPYYAMHGVNRFSHLPEDVQLQATLFMQRLSNTVVGLTILDSFVLTGGLISSLITAIVTYFSVIMES